MADTEREYCSTYVKLMSKPGAETADGRFHIVISTKQWHLVKEFKILFIFLIFVRYRGTFIPSVFSCVTHPRKKDKYQ